MYDMKALRKIVESSGFEVAMVALATFLLSFLFVDRGRLAAGGKQRNE